MAVLAQLLTSTRRAGDRARRAQGAALLAGAGVVAAAGVAVAFPGVVRPICACAATALLVFALVKLLEADGCQRQAKAEARLLGALVAQLPQRWYVLGDLEIEPSWLEPVQIWAVVVGPGGVAVVHPCAEEGDLTPFGHIWMVERRGRVRTIPSPAAQACTEVEALREVLGTEQIPIVPVVVLTDVQSLFHQAETGADVVGIPHAAAGLRYKLDGDQQIWDPLQLAAFLTHYHR
ncbi:MAG TPA: NERD domain-containing protein [Symbiobacteriaceae bacterium]|nr:NERD domain-containing protein [Symbiobacteriaceae bacterium]